MTTTSADLGVHPVPAAIEGATDVLEKLAVDGDAALWTLADAQLTSALASVLSLVARAQSVLVGLVGEVDSRGLSTATGASSTVAWLRHHHRLGPYDASKLVRTASEFRDGLPLTRAALSDGTISLEHAHVIARACADLPDDLHPAVAALAEEHLLADANEADPVTTRRTSRWVISRVDPDGEDARDGKRLADAEKRAAKRNALDLFPDGEGGSYIRGRLDGDGTAIVGAALAPLMAPRADTGEGLDHRSVGQRRAEALVELCRRALAQGDLPSHGGFKPQVVVTIPFRTLTEQLGVGMLPDGTAISPAAARHWACDAGIIAAVLDGHSRPLDVTDEKRLFEGRLRRALELRDGGCAFPGCDRPVAWCEGHHIIGWAAGGETKLANGVLLCRHHHRLVEDGDWTVWIHADGFPIWRPPAWVDPQQRLQRNRCHRPDQPRPD